jgi:GMP synthase (glutamine-hydrolysing)
MRIHAIYHVPFEKLGAIEDWIIQKDHLLSETCLYNNQALPSPGEFDMLVLMGGPMSVNDKEYPWMGPEKDLIRAAIREGKIVLGICLGAQLIAASLGSEVYRGREKEIGWYPVVFTKGQARIPLLPGQDEMTVFHWHGETFDLPAEALCLASSEVTPNQAFLYRDQVLGVQFHLEMKPENIRMMIDCAGDEVREAPYVQSAAELMNGLVHRTANRSLLELWLNFLEQHANQHNNTITDVN